jgi:hypothetical protein
MRGARRGLVRKVGERDNSSGVQLNCSYSHRYISVSVWYGLNPLPGVEGRESIDGFKPYHTDTEMYL